MRRHMRTSAAGSVFAVAVLACMGVVAPMSAQNVGGAGAGVGAGIIAHENVLNRMSAPTGKSAPYPTTAWPTDTFVSKQKELYFNGESIQTIYKPGHTDGDSIVYFRKSDVISAGELFNTLTFPVIDLSRGGSVKGVLAGLNDMLDIA